MLASIFLVSLVFAHGENLDNTDFVQMSAQVPNKELVREIVDAAVGKIREGQTTVGAKRNVQWTIGEDLSGSCDNVCGSIGGTCSQADLDNLAFSGSNKQPDAAKNAYESASPASLTCNNWNTGCSGGNCPNWGLPFIHKSHFNDNLCWGGDAAAACGQNPVDGHHRRLCPCSMPVPAVCPSGWVQEGPLGTDQGGCGLEGCGARYGSSADSPESCAAHCDANANCEAFNWAPMNGDKNHGGNRVCTIYSSATTNQMWPSTSGEFTQVFCKRVECPNGWVQEGPFGTDQGGCGLESCGARYGSSADSPASCAAHCDANANCQAFNWAPMNGDKNHGGNRVCTIYNSATTNQMWPSTSGEFTQIFCKPAPPPFDFTDHASVKEAFLGGQLVAHSKITSADAVCPEGQTPFWCQNGNPSASTDGYDYCGDNTLCPANVLQHNWGSSNNPGDRVDGNCCYCGACLSYSGSSLLKGPGGRNR